VLTYRPNSKGIRESEWLSTATEHEGWCGVQSTVRDLTRGDEQTVAIAGDWHADLRHVPAALVRMHLARPDVRTVLQLGDFGLGRHAGAVFLDAIERLAATLNVRVLVTPGVHDDWRNLHRAFTTHPNAPFRLTPHVAALPRGLRFRLASREFLSFGGAATGHGDGVQRHLGQDVAPTADEVRTAARDGRVDVLLLHEAVEGGVRKVSTKIRYEARRNRISRADQEASQRSRALVTELRRLVAPTVTLHGRMHIRGSVHTGGASIVSLSRENRSGNIGYLDLETLGFTWLEQACAERTDRAS
jgi:hypothetical protein